MTLPEKALAVSNPLAQWVFTANPTDTSVTPANASFAATGSGSDGAKMTIVAGNAWGTSGKTFIGTNGWDNGSGTKYWEFDVPAGASATGMTFSAQIQVSKTAPKYWKVQASANGLDYSDVTNGKFQSVSSMADIQFADAGTTALPLPDYTKSVRVTPFDNTPFDNTNYSTVQAGGVSYINNIVITGSLGAQAPTSKISPVTAQTSVTPGENNSVPSGTTVTLACATAGAQIYYTINGGAVQVYAQPIKLTENTSISAYAVAGGEKSDPYSFSYTVSSASATAISAVRGMANGAAATVSGVVTRVVNSSTMYVQDSTGGICVFGGSFTAADYPGGTPVTVSGTVNNYQGVMELTNSSSTAKDLTVTKTGGSLAPITPAVVALSDFSSNPSKYEGQLIQIQSATLKVSGSSYSLTSGSTSVPLYSKNGSKVSAADGSTVNAAGIATIYKSAAELLFADAADLTAAGGSTTGTAISAARGMANGAAATVSGVVTRVVNSSTMYVQDSTGGICVFGGSFTAADYPSGTPVTVSGTVNNYQGVMELTNSSSTAKDLTVTKTGGSLAPITPAVVALSDFSSNPSKYEGQLIQIQNATLKVSGSSYSLTSGSTSVPLYSKNGSKVSAADGSTVNAAGIATVYKSAAELLFADAADLTAAGGSGGNSGNTSGQVAAVEATPGSGAVVNVGDSITLSTTTDGASIKYKLNGASAYSDYTGPIKITELPLTISAYAVKTGIKDSIKTTITYDAPYSGTYNLYFGQLHSHTTLSDGQGTVEQAFAHASQVENLDFLAVTDHSNYFESATDATNHVNTILDSSNNAKWNEGHQSAADITSQQIDKGNVSDPSARFLGLYGYEMTWSDGSGHINTFNTPGFEDRQNPYYDNNAQSASDPSGLQKYYDTLTTVPQSASQFNHPGTTFGDFYDFADYSPAYDSLMDMVEVGNGEGPIRGAGYFPSYEYYTRALDKGWHVAPTNNQDNHRGNWGDANTARSVILAKDLSTSSLYDAMHQRRMYATEDNDLSIQYTLNGQVMGSVLSVKSGAPITLKADLSDPTDKSIGMVQVISNGGRVVASKTLDTNKGSVEFDLSNDYSYYYLRVTEPDADIAVTAPVWTNDVDKAGIASTTSDTSLPVKGEAVTITTSLYNNEQVPMQLESLQYSIGGQVIQTVPGSQLNGGQSIASLGTAQYQFSYTPANAGDQTVDVTLTANENGVEKTYTGTLQLSVADPKTVTRVLIDGTHFNSYVDGYYAGNMNNFTQIAANVGAQVKIATDASQITPDVLKTIQLLVITSPATQGGTTKAGTAYTPQTFSSDFISMVKDYVAGGGRVVVCGTSDYGDGAGEYKASTQINNLLTGIGATARVRADEMKDDVTNGGQNYRLYLQNFSSTASLLNGVVTGSSGQEYSAYSGCSVNPGAGASLVTGFDTTYADVSSPSASNVGTVTVQKGSHPVALSEETVGKGEVVTSGTILLSDFEIKATKDNNWDLPYANYNIMSNLLKETQVSIPITNIADIRQNGKDGDVYAVEGTVTVGTEQPNAFTDTLYLQDGTGGMDVYPIANGSGIKVGEKIRVIGHVSSYQGDKELKIGSGVEGYEVLDSSIHPLAPTAMSAKDAMDYDQNGGKLVSVTGTVSNVQQDGGAIQSFILNDGSNANGARIFINGYIDPNVSLSNVVQEGTTVTAVGVVYTDPNGVSLRVRDKNEIVPVQTGTPGGGTSSSASSGNSSAGGGTSGSASSGNSSAGGGTSNSASSGNSSAGGGTSGSASSSAPSGTVSNPDTGTGAWTFGLSLSIVVLAAVLAAGWLTMRRRTH
ncbi:CehA/McbA family metallohydrolase [Ethanoligenens harbinense]|nr:CehA/McbA family metallohydrolase [Ethanoligenens harbinense]